MTMWGQARHGGPSVSCALLLLAITVAGCDAVPPPAGTLESVQSVESESVEYQAASSVAGSPVGLLGAVTVEELDDRDPVVAATDAPVVVPAADPVAKGASTVSVTVPAGALPTDTLLLTLSSDRGVSQQVKLPVSAPVLHMADEAGEPLPDGRYFYDVTVVPGLRQQARIPQPEAGDDPAPEATPRERAERGAFAESWVEEEEIDVNGRDLEAASKARTPTRSKGEFTVRDGKRVEVQR